MNKAEYEKKLLQEKIAANRRIFQLESKQIKQEMHPARAARHMGKKLAPKLATIPVIKYITSNKNNNTLRLAVIAGAALIVTLLGQNKQK
ncbi:MAG: hypothetical protein DWQ10_00815 [Calditrichaeota bacterium]|nr:MAG: hypothetical protein DWQ10_00815 [Calditrichota bacterium]